MSTRPLRCRLGLHSFRRVHRDAGGRYFCGRCGQQGRDEHVDAHRMPPWNGGGNAS